MTPIEIAILIALAMVLFSGICGLIWFLFRRPTATSLKDDHRFIKSEFCNSAAQIIRETARCHVEEVNNHTNK